MMNRRGDAMAFKIPKPITLEHDELHAKLVRAIREGGKIGYAAQVVAKILHPHFVKEEEYALPPLGLLTALAKGKITKESMFSVFPMARVFLISKLVLEKQ